MKRSVILLFAALSMAASLPAAELRTFTNAKGEEIKAELISATETHAELKRQDGKQFKVALTTLSEADRKWIAEWRKTHKHFKVQVLASVKKGNTREGEGDRFAVKKAKGNDCWYAINFKNTAPDPLKGLRVDYVVFAPGGNPAASVCGSVEVPEIPAGKSGQALTEKLFVEQAQTTWRSGNASMVQYSENTLAGIRAELFVDGRPAGVFLAGKLPDDAAAQLQTWREQQPGYVPPAAPEQKKP